MSHITRAIKISPRQLFAAAGGITIALLTALLTALITALFISPLTASLATAQTLPTEVTQGDPVTDYLDAIETAEAELSAYSVELSDLYFGLGKSHFSKREYERARQAYQRGMQIERVNYGLDSISQSPYLLSIAEAESYLGNWDQSHNALENLYQINAKAYGETDPRMLPVLDELLDWYMTTYKERTLNGAYQNLVISERLSNRMYRILVNSVPMDDPDAASRYRKISHLHYFIANHIKQHGEPSESGLTINSSATTRALDSTSHLHYRRGKAALQKVIESLEQQPDSSAVDKALAIAELGDWYLVFGQRMSASKTYKLAYDTLGENSEKGANLFDQPSMIEFTALGDNLELAESRNTQRSQSLPRRQLEVSMTVTKIGIPEKMEIIDPPEDITKKEIRTIFREIRSKRFRPRLVDGETINSNMVYPYLDKGSESGSQI